MGTLFTVAALTLIISGMCSLFEATLYSTTVPTLEAARAKGRKRHLARRFLTMKTAIARPTSAILILNTLANTGGATIAGMYAAQVLGVSWVPVFSGGLTLGILLLSEILPKTYGAVHWRRLWPFIVWPLTVMEKLFYPVIRSLEGLTRLLTRGTPAGQPTEGEIVSMIRLGARSGELRRHRTATVELRLSLRRDGLPPSDGAAPRGRLSEDGGQPGRGAGTGPADPALALSALPEVAG